MLDPVQGDGSLLSFRLGGIDAAGLLDDADALDARSPRPRFSSVDPLPGAGLPFGVAFG